MFKSLIEKHHAKPQIGLEEGVKAEVFCLNWPPLLMSRRGCSLGQLAGEKDM